MSIMKRLLICGVLLLLVVGCCACKSAESVTRETVVKAYEEKLKEKDASCYYAIVESSTKYPFLFVTDDVYNDPTLGQDVSIWADIYYYVDGKITDVATLSSGGTAYPISKDENGFYVGANHGGSYYIYDEDKKHLVMKENILVEYDEDGNESYTHEVDEKVQDNLEESFTKFFEKYGKAEAIAFEANKVCNQKVTD